MENDDDDEAAREGEKGKTRSMRAEVVYRAVERGGRWPRPPRRRRRRRRRHRDVDDDGGGGGDVASRERARWQKSPSRRERESERHERERGHIAVDSGRIGKEKRCI